MITVDVALFHLCSSLPGKMGYDARKERNACRMAHSYESPNRQRLYEIYQDAQLDAHLTGTIAQLNNFIKARSFKLVDESGEAVDDAAHYFDQPWFKELVDYFLEAPTYDWLIECGRRNDLGLFERASMHTIPKKYALAFWDTYYPPNGWNCRCTVVQVRRKR